jgi:hypothetical protein
VEDVDARHANAQVIDLEPDLREVVRDARVRGHLAAVGATSKNTATATSAAASRPAGGHP